MGYYLVLGPNDRNANIRLAATEVTIDFVAGTAVESTTTTFSPVTAAQSGLYSIDRPNGQIVYVAKIQTN